MGFSQYKMAKHAGFIYRFVAFIIDTVILNVVLIPLNYTFGFNIWTVNVFARDMWTNIGLSALVGIIVSWLYFAYLESSEYQGTIGKIILKLKVTDEGGRKINFAKATVRHFSKILSSLILGIGYLMIAFTKKKQGLHDIIAKTLVVRKQFLYFSFFLFNIGNKIIFGEFKKIIVTEECCHPKDVQTDDDKPRLYYRTMKGKRVLEAKKRETGLEEDL